MDIVDVSSKKLQHQRQTMEIVEDFVCEDKFLHFSSFFSIYIHFSLVFFIFDSFSTYILYFPF